MNGPVTWFIKNPIAGNLLMVLLIIGGVASIPKLDKQFFPTPEINQIEIRMEFRGASPSEVEEQISVRIEEAVHDLNGIEFENSILLTALIVLGILFVHKRYNSNNRVIT